MNELKRNEMAKKVKEYDEFKESINNIIKFISLPDYVMDKYNGQEECNMKLTLSFGNGSREESLTITEGHGVFKKIISELKVLKEMYEKEIEKL